MKKSEAEIIVSVLPVAINLAADIIEFITKAKKSGFEVPSLDRLLRNQEELKSLPDLEENIE